MRVALVHSYYRSEQPSGENVVVDAEAVALRRSGMDVRVVAASTDDSAGQALYGARAALRVATGRGADPLDEIRSFEPDVVHVHNLFPNFGRRWVDQVEVPVVHTLHNYRPLCANALLLREGRVCTLCPDGDRWAGVRYGCYRGSRIATAPLGWANRNGPMADPLIRRADRLLVLSEVQRDVYERAGVPPDRLTVTPHFLPDALDPGPQPPPPADAAWLFVGRLSEEKGILRLLEHWPAGEPLTLIGDGPERTDVQRLAERVGAEVLGPLPRGGVVRAMARSIGLVVPSLVLETFGLVYLEALAAGTPVVAFAPTVVAEAVERDRTGAVASWDGGLDQALQHVRRRRDELGRTCRDVFDRAYSEARYVERTKALYGSLVR